MSTLFEEVTGWLYHQQAKHDKPADYVERYINDMTQFEFLEAISQALGNVLVKRDRAGQHDPNED